LPQDKESKPSSGDKSQREKGSTEEKGEETVGVDISSLDTYTTLKLFMSILAGQAWRKMGLVVDPRTNKIEKDMTQAKTAIDCFQLILKQLENHLSEDEKSKLNSLLSDLQVNFVTHQ
jgi:hypothetical protein